MSLLPTPRASDTGTPGRRASEGFRPPLSEVLLTQLLPTPRTINSKSGRAMEASRENGRRSGGGQSSPPGLEELAQLMAGHVPAHMPAPDRLPEATRKLLPTPRTSDTNGAGQHGSGGLDLRSAIQLLPTPMASDGGSDRASSAGFGLRDTSRKIPDQWGPYAGPVARWEAVTGRPVPSPTEPGANGQPRLAPPFVEWLMGLPAGWVTDHLGRGPSLKCLGNGVVWQQAAHAYTELLAAA